MKNWKFFEGWCELIIEGYITLEDYVFTENVMYRFDDRSYSDGYIIIWTGYKEIKLSKDGFNRLFRRRYINMLY